MELDLATRRRVTATMARKYALATKAGKAAILDHLVEVTGWHRDHARKAMRAALARLAAGEDPGVAPPRAPRTAALKYDAQVIAALTICWAVLDGRSGKLLAPALPDLVDALAGHGELDDYPAEVLTAVKGISAATIDRRLAEVRKAANLPRGRSWTRPGSILKSQIPMRTWAQWDDARPGFIEVDLVGHDGGDLNGEFCFTLTCTDVATGWTENRTVRNKASKWVFAALVELQAQFPFPVLGIDSDNGSEFINSHLMNYCLQQQITFTRSRPNNKNDGCFVEQKNYVIARRTAGYWRYETPGEMATLNQIWAALSPLTNLFTPQQKLASKTRVGAKVTKRYDTAKTPYQRLLAYHAAHPDQQVLDDHDAKMLAKQHEAANPAQLRRAVSDLQGDLINKVKKKQVTKRGLQHAVYLSQTKSHLPQRPSNKRASSNESTTHPTRAS